MARPEKEAAVKEIARRFGESDAVLLTEYRGLTVSEIADLRTALRATDSEYKVLKNTLARIAVREVGLEELVGMLEGPTAIAFIKGDAAAAAKALDEAAKKYPVLVIKGGVLKGKIIDAAQAKQLAQLEPREVILAKIAMMFNQPAQSAVNVFGALLRDLGSMLAQVLTQKESEAPPAEAAPEPEAEPVAEPGQAPEPVAEAVAEAGPAPAPTPEAEAVPESEPEATPEPEVAPEPEPEAEAPAEAEPEAEAPAETEPEATAEETTETETTETETETEEQEKEGE